MTSEARQRGSDDDAMTMVMCHHPLGFGKALLEAGWWASYIIRTHERSMSLFRKNGKLREKRWVPTLLHKVVDIVWWCWAALDRCGWRRAAHLNWIWFVRETTFVTHTPNVKSWQLSWHDELLRDWKMMGLKGTSFVQMPISCRFWIYDGYRRPCSNHVTKIRFF